MKRRGGGIERYGKGYNFAHMFNIKMSITLIVWLMFRGKGEGGGADGWAQSINSS